MSTLPITQVATATMDELLNPVPGSRMALPGFDAEFVDFPDYIVRITDRIWHDRDVELCRRYYSENCIVHTQAGTVIGVEPVLAGTYATMESFPDRRLEPDNVIWSEDPAQVGSPNPVFYSSHFITSKMTNLGASEFGPATQRKIRVITIADCACRDNVIFEEWLVRDYAAIIAQLGLDVNETAVKFAARDRAMGVDIISAHAESFERVRAQRSPLNDHADADWARAFITRSWGDLDFGAYEPRTSGRYPYGRDLYGGDDIGALVARVRAAIPDAVMSIDHVASVPYLGEARDIAIRWSLAGYHSEDGWFGDASELPVYMIGITHLRVLGERILSDLTLWDDFAVRRMIEGARK